MWKKLKINVYLLHLSQIMTEDYDQTNVSLQS